MHVQSLNRYVEPPLKRNGMFIPLPPHVNDVVLKKYSIGMKCMIWQLFCGIAALNRGMGEIQRQKTENLGVAQQFCK